MKTGTDLNINNMNNYSSIQGEVEDESSQGKKITRTEARKDCPYLYTVKKWLPNFSFEKRCCVSLSDHNAYACLVCGKYYQGRWFESTYNHSIKEDHHVHINLRTGKVYCLPDGYEVIDPSLDDVRQALNLNSRFHVPN